MVTRACALRAHARVRRAHLSQLNNSHFLGGAKLRNTVKHVKKKEQRQVNKKFCELKRGNIEKAQETRFGMSPKYGRYIGIAS